MKKEEQLLLFPQLKKVPEQLRESAKRLIENTEGLGIKNKQAPVSVMLPPDMDKKVRRMKNRSKFIRDAISEKLSGNNGAKEVDYDKAIAQYLVTLPLAKQKEIKQHLTEFVESLKH